MASKPAKAAWEAPARHQPRTVESIHLVRDTSSSTVAGLYESSVAPIFTLGDFDELPEPKPESRWLMFGDQALAAAQEEQCRIKEKIRPHMERYRRITGRSK